MENPESMRLVGFVAAFANQDVECVAFRAREKGAVIAKTKISDAVLQIAVLAKARRMHSDDMIIVHADMQRQPPIGFDLSCEISWRPIECRERLEDREAIAEIVSQRSRIGAAGEPTKDQGTAYGDLDGVELGAQFAWRHTKKLGATGNADRPTFLVIHPVMKAATDDAISLWRVAQWIMPMRAAVFKSPDCFAKTLNEDGSAAQPCSDPIIVAWNVGR